MAPIDLSTVGSVTPTPVPVTEGTGPSAAGVDLRNAKEATPPTVGVTAQMEPLAAAGVDLTKRVLWYVSAAIVLLLFGLAIVEFNTAFKANQVYERAVAEVTKESAEPDAVKDPLAYLIHARTDPTWKPTADEKARANAQLGVILANSALTADQRSVLAKCGDLPAASDPKRTDTIDRCVASLSSLNTDLAAKTAKIKLLEELDKLHLDREQAFRAFWLQTAQLILMNLFFPLLTGLLGYVFGTSKAASAA